MAARGASGAASRSCSFRSPAYRPRPRRSSAALPRAITPRTRVLVFSHVQYTDGTVMPARELCILARANNAISLVDGAQALRAQSTSSIAAMGCDAYATSFHKWLNGSYGTGALYVRPDLRPRLWPLTVERPTGWDVADRFGVRRRRSRRQPTAGPRPRPSLASSESPSGRESRRRLDRDRVAAGSQPRTHQCAAARARRFTCGSARRAARHRRS